MKTKKDAFVKHLLIHILPHCKNKGELFLQSTIK